MYIHMILSIVHPVENFIIFFKKRMGAGTSLTPDPECPLAKIHQEFEMNMKCASVAMGLDS